MKKLQNNAKDLLKLKGKLPVRYPYRLDKATTKSSKGYYQLGSYSREVVHLKLGVPLVASIDGEKYASMFM